VTGPLASPAVPSDAPPRLDHHERMRLRAAAFQARRVYPGPVGELVSRELLDFEGFGFRLGGQGPINRLVAAVMAAEIPTPAPPVAVA